MADKKVIEKIFLIITPIGERKTGLNGFIYWCQKTKQPIGKTAKEYVKTLKKYKEEIDELFKKVSGIDFTVINDADAAALAEINFGAGKNKDGLVAVITLGTGIGSGLFFNGDLIPNTELGHVVYKGEPFENYAADSIRKNEDLSYKKWGKRLDKYFKHIELILSPDLFIIGGGASKKMDRYIDEVKINAPIIPAENKNEAGIIGAAIAAAEGIK